jgi:hypothetical protein
MQEFSPVWKFGGQVGDLRNLGVLDGVAQHGLPLVLVARLREDAT